MTTKCEYCEEQLEGVFISTGTGVSCEKCYYEKHPFINKDSFMAVLCNCDDQVLVRRLLEDNVPPEIKQWIIDDFNKEMTARHEARLAS